LRQTIAERADFWLASYRDRQRQRCRPTTPWNGSSRDIRQTSRAAKPIWRCATSRRKAATLHLKGKHLRLCCLPVPRRRRGCVGHPYRGAGALRARAPGPAASRGNGKNGGAARLIDALASGSDPLRHRSERTALRPSPARTPDSADPRNRGRILGHCPPRSTPRRLHARGNRLG
jgi:hypothetical protein